MKSLAILVHFVTVMSINLACAAETVYSEEFEGVTVAGYVADSAEIEELAKKLAEAWKTQSLATPRLAVIWIGTTRELCAEAAWGKGRFHIDYEWWVSRFKREIARREPMAQVVLSQRGAGLRTRNANGEVRRLVFWGEDPFWFSDGALRCEVLDMRFPGMAPLKLVGYKKDQALIYLRCERRPDDSTARSLASKVMSQNSLKAALVMIREDSWFIDNPFFPVFYPFESELNPPSRQEYLASRSVFCDARSADIYCKSGTPLIMHGRSPDYRQRESR